MKYFGSGRLNKAIIRHANTNKGIYAVQDYLGAKRLVHPPKNMNRNSRSLLHIQEISACSLRSSGTYSKGSLSCHFLAVGTRKRSRSQRGYHPASILQAGKVMSQKLLLTTLFHNVCFFAAYFKPISYRLSETK